MKFSNFPSIVVVLSFTNMIKAAHVEMERIDLNHMNPDAICNDGTPALYYWKESQIKTNDWLLYLEAGGECYSAATCLDRKATDCHLTSSRCDGNTTSDEHGIFDDRPENPLAKANKAFLRYCSSDTFVGDIIRPHVMEFHGYAFAMAFVDHLVIH